MKRMITNNNFLVKKIKWLKQKFSFMDLIQNSLKLLTNREEHFHSP